MKHITLFLMFTSSIAFAQTYPRSATKHDLDIANSTFKFEGKFINPMLISEFEGYDSDTGTPVITSVDVAAAADTNQFYADNLKYTKDGGEYTEDSGDKSDPYYHSYRWIGRMKNGLEVVESTSGGGGGSMVGNTLFLLRFSLAKAFRPAPGIDNYPLRLMDSKKPLQVSYTRLLLTVDRFYIIGDRMAASYEIKGNELIVHITNQDKPITKVISVEGDVGKKYNSVGHISF